MATLFAIALLAWIPAALMFAAISWALGGRSSTADLISFSVYGGLGAVTAGLIVLAPLMFSMRRRTNLAISYVLAGALLGVIGLLALGAVVGEPLGGFSNPARWAFVAPFVVFGGVFGASFHRAFVARAR